MIKLEISGQEALILSRALGVLISQGDPNSLVPLTVLLSKICKGADDAQKDQQKQQDTQAAQKAEEASDRKVPRREESAE